MKKVTVFVTAAALSMATVAPAAFAQDFGDEMNMLTGAVFNALNQFGVDTDGISNLTLAQIAQLREILSGDSMSDAQKRNEINRILEAAG